MEEVLFMMKALVTGGAGFIGSNLTKFLCDHGWDVTVVDDLSFGFERLVDKRAKFVKGSVADEKILAKILPGTEVVFHLAALSTITYAADNPMMYFQHNVMNGIKLLEGMKKAGVKKIIYSSSAANYGEPKRIPINENDIKEPINTYGASKLIFERALSAYFNSFGIESVSLRYFNVYGPNDEQAGTRAVPRWIKAALNDEPLVLYWGGNNERDYIFVEDVARANFMAVEKCGGFKVYNVGSGRGVFMKDIAKKLGEIIGKKLTIQDGGERLGDPSQAIADITKIQRELGWQPTVGLDLGLKLTVDYFKNRLQKS